MHSHSQLGPQLSCPATLLYLSREFIIELLVAILHFFLISLFYSLSSHLWKLTLSPTWLQTWRQSDMTSSTSSFIAYNLNFIWTHDLFLFFCLSEGGIASVRSEYISLPKLWIIFYPASSDNDVINPHLIYFCFFNLFLLTTFYQLIVGEVVHRYQIYPVDWELLRSVMTSMICCLRDLSISDKEYWSLKL